MLDKENDSDEEVKDHSLDLSAEKGDDDIERNLLKQVDKFDNNNDLLSP